MGYYVKKWLLSFWCLLCILIGIGIAFLFSFTPLGIVLGVILAFFLFFINVFISLIKRRSQKLMIEKIDFLICPICKIQVKKEIGICPECGNKL
ncbi:MAG: hypothetical protein ACFFEO_16460 [Candidatus Thorarchaeota archaeon]